MIRTRVPSPNALKNQPASRASIVGSLLTQGVKPSQPQRSYPVALWESSLFFYLYTYVYM